MCGVVKFFFRRFDNAHHHAIITDLNARQLVAVKVIKHILIANGWSKIVARQFNAIIVIADNLPHLCVGVPRTVCVFLSVAVWIEINIEYHSVEHSALKNDFKFFASQNIIFAEHDASVGEAERIPFAYLRRLLVGVGVLLGCDTCNFSHTPRIYIVEHIYLFNDLRAANAVYHVNIRCCAWQHQAFFCDMVSYRRSIFAIASVLLRQVALTTKCDDACAVVLCAICCCHAVDFFALTQLYIPDTASVSALAPSEMQHASAEPPFALERLGD